MIQHLIVECRSPGRRSPERAPDVIALPLITLDFEGRATAAHPINSLFGLHGLTEVADRPGQAIAQMSVVGQNGNPILIRS